MLYVVGRKALSYFTFRNWTVAESWVGFTDKPTYENAQEIADTLVEAFLAGADDDGDGAGDDGILGVDELHIVFTEFRSMLTQSAEARRIAPMVVEYVESRYRAAHAVLVRARRHHPVRVAASALRGDPDLLRTARGCGLGVGVASSRHEGGLR